jgi:hypothetical protein
LDAIGLIEFVHETVKDLPLFLHTIFRELYFYPAVNASLVLDARHRFGVKNNASQAVTIPS